MKRSWISTGLALVLPLVAIFLLWNHGIGAARRARQTSRKLGKTGRTTSAT